jgi:large repetitive protein
MRGLMRRRQCHSFRRVGVLFVCAAAAALLLPASGQAQGGRVRCGATITTDTKLKTDLANCPNNGLVIGADDITLDLNGHAVDGDGEPVASCPADAACDVGIDNTAGHAGVKIEGGAVRGFNVGVLVLGASENRIHRLASATNSRFGLMVDNSTHTRVDHNSSVSDGVFGIFLLDSHDGRIDHNSVAGAHGFAIPVFGSSRIRVTDNVLDRNDHGIALDHADDNEIASNRISHSRGSSLDVGGSDNRIKGNRVTDSGDGIVGGGIRNVISDNTVARSGFFGSPDTGGFGLILDGGQDNVVIHNEVTGGRGPAIYVAQLDSPDPPAHTVVSHNVANSRLSDGILVDGPATATVLDGNTADGSGDDGIDVEAPGTTLTRNTADANRDLGIEAVPGVIDGGGNRASRNGNVFQCTNLTCR